MIITTATGQQNYLRQPEQCNSLITITTVINRLKQGKYNISSNSDKSPIILTITSHKPTKTRHISSNSDKNITVSIIKKAKSAITNHKKE